MEKRPENRSDASAGLILPRAYTEQSEHGLWTCLSSRASREGTLRTAATLVPAMCDAVIAAGSSGRALVRSATPLCVARGRARS
jgi:hypothetical protein